MALATWALAAVLAAHDGGNVTLRLPATRAEAAVVALAAKTGRNLKASPTVASEVFVLNVTDVPVDELLRRMADAASARWERAPDGSQVLTADPAKRAAEERQVRDRRRAALEKSFRAIAQEMAKPATTSPTGPDAEEYPASGGSAERTLTGRVALALGVAAFEAVPAGGRTVYATAPTPVQRPLRVANLEALVDAFVKEHNEGVQQAEQASMETNSEQMSAEERQMMESLREMFGGRDFKPKKIEKAVAKVLAAIESGGDPMLTVVLYDAEGNALGESRRALGAYMDETMEAMMSEGEVTEGEEAGGEPPKEKPIDPRLDKPVELAPLSAELEKRSASRFESVATEPISDDLRTALLRPDEIDPLAYALSDSLLQTADSLETDLVASVPDDLVGWSFVRGQPKKLGQFWIELNEDADVKITTDGTWTVLRPAEPSVARKDRIDRPALRVLLNASAGRTVCPLDALAAYAAKNDELSDSPLAQGFVALVAPGVINNGLPGQSEWDMLRLWGRLTPDLRSALRSGSRVSVGRLPAGAKEVVDQMVYGHGATFLVGDAAPPSDPFAEMMAMGMGRFGQPGDWRNEPTEALPNGLPVDGYLTLAQRPTSWVVPVKPDGTPLFPMGPVGATEIGMLTAMLELDKTGQMATYMPTFKDFVHGNRNELKFTFTYRPGLRQERKLLDDQEGDGKPVPLDGLPTAFLEEVAKAKEQMKTSPFAKLIQMGGFGNRGPVTPP